MPRSLDRVSKNTLGKNLAEARTKLQLTQEDAAQRSNIRRDRISRWESGRETPGAEGLLLLAIAYECSIDQFFSGVDERYDEIIERRIPADAARHFREKTEAFIRRTTAAMQLALGEAVHVPTRAMISETPAAKRDKSPQGSLRLRRGRGK